MRVISGCSLLLFLATGTVAIGGPTNPGEITPCPDSPNCVSSLEKGTGRYTPPLSYAGSTEDARIKLIKVLKGFERVEIVESSGDYIHASFTSSVFGFVDDAQFLIEESEKSIHMKSASRSGYYDFGVNRRRCEAIRERFERSHP